MCLQKIYERNMNSCLRLTFESGDVSLIALALHTTSNIVCFVVGRIASEI